MTRPVDLVIFDCDGVLIDSEILVCRYTSEELTRLGYPIGIEEVIRRFAGRGELSMLAEIERDWGRPVPAAYAERMRARIVQCYPTELQAVPDVAETLGQLRVPICVASSSYPEKLEAGLRVTGLLDRFDGDVISATRVAHGKPAPDVFVYAAGWMHAEVACCVVVEDSAHGVQAARAAGMRVIGFTGGSHCGPGHGDTLRAAGAEHVIAHLGDLRSVVPEAFRPKAHDRPGIGRRTLDMVTTR